MKKKILIILSIIVLIALIIGTMYIIDRIRMKNNKPVIFSTWGYSYAPPENSNKLQENKEIESIDDFYNISLTKDNDIRNLGELYNSFDAQKDNCFVIGAMVHNDYLYYEFMQSYKNDKSSFIRVAQNTIEGDLILCDILYYDTTKKLYLVTDNTRDEFSASEDRKIELKQFDNISEYTYDNHLYWILYSGEINDENFNSDNVFIITIIN